MASSTECNIIDVVKVSPWQERNLKTLQKTLDISSLISALAPPQVYEYKSNQGTLREW